MTDRLAVRVRTHAGWLTGLLSLPAGANLYDYLNGGSAVLRLVDVVVPGHMQPCAFFALERKAAMLVIPEVAGPLESAGAMPGPRAAHPVTVLLDDGAVVLGQVVAVEGVRLSDHLARHGGFIALRDLVVAPGRGHDGPQHAVAYLNAAHVIGMSELS
jgi:hypothetical protein